MPQISPMKWTMLNLITQSSILQIISFMSMKKVHNFNQVNSTLKINKMTWKW